VTRPAVTVSVPAEHVAAVVAALRVGAAELLRTDRTRSTGPAYDGRGPLQLAAALERGLANAGHEIGHDTDRWITISNAVGISGVPGRTLRRRAESGQVRGKRIGGTWLIHQDDVEREKTRRKAHET